MDAPANQPGAPSDFGAFSFAENSFTTSVYIEGAVTGTFQVGEQVTWTNTGLPSAYQSVTATVHYFDVANNKLWLRNMSHPLAMEVAGDTTVTGGTSSATISAGPSYAGSGGTMVTLVLLDTMILTWVEFILTTTSTRTTLTTKFLVKLLN